MQILIQTILRNVYRNKPKKTKWLLFAGYNPSKTSIDTYIRTLSHILDYHMIKYENLIILGDFNSVTKEASMAEFCDLYNLKSLIKSPTCFKSLINTSCIDLILTNKCKKFQESSIVETGLSDDHKMVTTAMRSYFPKQQPKIVEYRDYKNFNTLKFQRN